MVHQHGDHHDIPDEHRIVRPGAWLPADHRIHKVIAMDIAEASFAY